MKDLTKISNEEFAKAIASHLPLKDGMLEKVQAEILKRMEFRPCTECEWCENSGTDQHGYYLCENINSSLRKINESLSCTLWEEKGETK